MWGWGQLQGPGEGRRWSWGLAGQGRAPSTWWRREGGVSLQSKVLVHSFGTWWQLFVAITCQPLGAWNRFLHFRHFPRAACLSRTYLLPQPCMAPGPCSSGRVRARRAAWEGQPCNALLRQPCGTGLLQAGFLGRTPVDCRVFSSPSQLTSQRGVSQVAVISHPIAPQKASTRGGRGL